MSSQLASAWKYSVCSRLRLATDSKFKVAAAQLINHCLRGLRESLCRLSHAVSERIAMRPLRRMIDAIAFRFVLATAKSREQNPVFSKAKTGSVVVCVATRAMLDSLGNELAGRCFLASV